MYEFLFIAKNNMKKKKGDVAILFFLIALSALILYVSISVMTNMNSVLQRAHDVFHGADFFYTAPKSESDAIADIIFEQEEVSEYATTQAWFPQGGVKYRSKTSQDEPYLFLFEAIEEERTIGKLPSELVENVNYSSIILPYYLKADGSFDIGDSFYLTVRDMEYEFKVSGFAEDPVFANPIVISVFRCYIAKDCLQDILEQDAMVEQNHYQTFQVRFKEGIDSQEFDDKIVSQLEKEIPQLSNSLNIGLNWADMKSGDSLLSMIVMAIMLVFSILLIIIALIIVRFSIRNFIEENLRNIGILNACGYTTKQLQKSTILEMFIIAVIGSACGLIFGIVSSRFIGNVQASMMGVSWHQKIDIMTAVVVLVLITGIVLAGTYIVSRNYGKLSVLDALRGGIHTHNFRRNYLPFEKSMIPIPINMGLKSILREKVKNLSIFFIFTLLSFASCVGFLIYENFVVEKGRLLEMSGIEIADAWVNGSDLETIGEKLKDVEQVDSVLYYNNNSVELIYNNKVVNVSCDSWSEPERLINEMVVDGRLPKYDNEITLTTKVSNELGVEVGDVIYVKAAGERKDYIVSGIDQKINEMGMKAMLTLAGEKRLNGRSQAVTLYIYAKDGYTFEQLQGKITSVYPNVQISDSKKQTESSMNGITMGMRLICIIFIVITIIVVTMVVTLLTKTRVMNERKNYGIQKALGFTTRQLILQTLMTNIPVDFIASVVGAVLAGCLSNVLVARCFSFCGIQKCELIMSPIWFFVTIIGITVVALLAAVMSSAKIRKIEPVKLLQEDF